MTITVNISAKVESELTRRAELAGVPMEQQAAVLLEEAVQSSASSETDSCAEESHFGRRLVEVCAMLHEFDVNLDISREQSAEWRPLDFT